MNAVLAMGFVVGVPGSIVSARDLVRGRDAESHVLRGAER